MAWLNSTGWLFWSGGPPEGVLLTGVCDWTEGERGEAYDGMDGLGWLVGVRAGDCIGCLETRNAEP